MQIEVTRTTMFRRVLERVENEHWTIEVTDFKSWMLGFSRFVGQWRTTELAKNQVRVDYTYTLHVDGPWLYPLNWLFANVFWKIYMGRVLANVRVLAEGDEPYQYAWRRMHRFGDQSLRR